MFLRGQGEKPQEKEWTTLSEETLERYRPGVGGKDEKGLPRKILSRNCRQRGGREEVNERRR